MNESATKEQKPAADWYQSCGKHHETASSTVSEGILKKTALF